MWGGRVLEHHPAFCISCHEMEPSYNGWIASGASKHHPDCIACHGQEGFWGTVDSELRGLRFMKIHFFEKRRKDFPISAKVPEEYCIRCHSVGKLLDSHKMLMTRGHTCGDCHQHKSNSKFSGELRR
jgi:cytochrome c nitrite reductase small subunit